MKGIFFQSLSFYLVFLAYVFLIPIKANGTPPPPPQLVSPPNSSTDIPLAPRLEWAPSPGAISYQVEIRAVLENEEYPIFFHETEDTYFDVPPGHLAVSIGYIWCVRTIEKIVPLADKFGGENKYSKWSYRSFETEMIPASIGHCEDDDDCDGIPDSIETGLLKTNPHKKTLFVRPKKEIDDESYKYWEEFYTKLFPGSSNGKVNIPAFVLAGIEVVVIGDMDNPYLPMKNFRYDPANDGKKPPCDILEITLKRREGSEGWPVYCGTADDAHHGGHTYLMSNDRNNRSFWSWSTIGYASSAEKSHKYFKTFIYPYALDNYFKEGVYEKIAVGQKPIVTDCRKYPDKCNQLSPFNLNDNDPPPNPPYTMKPDDTVEFNEIDFDSEGKIIRIGKRGKPYTKYQVLARTAVHEMGHALLGAVWQDHCQNPCCIMCRKIIDRDQKGFGPGCRIAETSVSKCQHGPGGNQDIRAVGVVFNHVH